MENRDLLFLCYILIIANIDKKLFISFIDLSKIDFMYHFSCFPVYINIL